VISIVWMTYLYLRSHVFL